MPTKTIGLDEEAYRRLKAEKREGESFSDTVTRITSELASDWRHGLGTYSEEAAEFEAAVERSRETTNAGLARRQGDVTDELAGESTEADQ